MSPQLFLPVLCINLFRNRSWCSVRCVAGVQNVFTAARREGSFIVNLTKTLKFFLGDGNSAAHHMRPFRDPTRPYPLLQLPVLMGHSRIHCRTRILQALPATPEQGSHLVHIKDSLQQLSSKNLSFHEFLFIRLSLSTLLDTPRAVAHPWYLSEMLPLPHLNHWHIFPTAAPTILCLEPSFPVPSNCHPPSLPLHNVRT